MRRLLLAVLLVSVLAGAGHGAPTAQSAKMYTGTDGIEVVLIQLQGKSYLARVTGSGSAFDNLVLPYTLESDSGRQMYATQWRGQSYYFLQYEQDRFGSSGRMVLYTPANARDALPLTYNEARSKTVAVAELLAQHERQTRDGTIARFGRFDRAGEQAKHERELSEVATRMNGDCGGTRLGMKVLWSSISDDQMKSLHIASFCGAPLDALRGLCLNAAVARTTIKDQVKTVTCRFGSPAAITLEANGTATWTTNQDTPNQEELARKQLLAAFDAAAGGGPAPSGDAPPWGKGRTLTERIALEKTTVCSDGKNHYVVLAPDEVLGSRLYYGDDKRLARVPGHRFLSGGMFMDPRVYNADGNSNFRGYDLRQFSNVETDAAGNVCKLRCGTRRTELKVVEPATAAKVVLGAQVVAPLAARAPHALARDDRGTYYYVDHGNTPDTERNFRLFVGPRGNLKLQPMTDIVSDSEGQIFATKSGKLRFVVGPGGAQSSWIAGKRVTKLMAVPVDGNGSLIYNDLGVYAGQRLGTPCDDF